MVKTTTSSHGYHGVEFTIQYHLKFSSCKMTAKLKSKLTVKGFQTEAEWKVAHG